MKSLFFCIIRPFITIGVFLLRFLPVRFEGFFFKALSRTIHPSIAGNLFEASFCSHLKNRGTRVEVQYLQAFESVDSGSATVDQDYLKRRLETNRTKTEFQTEICPTQRFDTFWSNA